MGKNDSTKTRVEPFMDFLGEDKNKLNQFLKLFNSNRKIEIMEDSFKVFYGKKTTKHEGEKAIPAPISLLKWYIDHPEQLAKEENKQDKYGHPSKKTIENRAAFFRGDSNKKNEAYEGIAKIKNRKEYKYGYSWFIFEGYTKPDIFIKTDSSIFIGEAKRTEPKLTGSVKWYEQRDQLIRHVDSVIDCGKKVYSFFILDSKKYENLEDHENQEKNLKFYKKSLPHRSDEDIKKIMETYIGCITWHELEEEFPELKTIFSKERSGK